MQIKILIILARELIIQLSLRIFMLSLEGKDVRVETNLFATGVYISAVNNGH